MHKLQACIVKVSFTRLCNGYWTQQPMVEPDDNEYIVFLLRLHTDIDPKLMALWLIDLLRSINCFRSHWINKKNGTPFDKYIYQKYIYTGPNCFYIKTNYNCVFCLCLCLLKFLFSLVLFVKNNAMHMFFWCSKNQDSIRV